MNGTIQICPLCKRPLNKSWDRHHLIPQSLGGKAKRNERRQDGTHAEIVNIHKICHAKIHSVFTERELANYYHTVKRLLENEYIRAFVKWVNKKDPDFYEKTKDTTRRKGKRKR